MRSELGLIAGTSVLISRALHHDTRCDFPFRIVLILDDHNSVHVNYMYPYKVSDQMSHFAVCP